MVTTKNLYDVAVIGGGPVGSQVAYKLAGMGYHTIVLEKKEKLSAPVCCSGIVSRECVETYSIPDSVIHRWANSACLFSPAMKSLRVSRDTPQAAILNRPAFDALWVDRAQSAGVEYCPDSEVRRIQSGKKTTLLDVIRRGERLTVQARVVVVAAGFGSWLVDGLGLKGAGDFVMGVQAEVKTNNIDEVEVYFGNKIAPSFFAWLVPTIEGKALAGLLSRRNPPAYLRSLLSRLVAEGKIVSGDVPFTYGGVPLKPLPKTYGERVLVVGTTAGQIKPLTGGGIYFGLLCADIAANTLNQCLSIDDLSADKLASYQRGWKRRLGRELRTGSWARRVFEKLDDHRLDQLFGIMESSGLINELSQSEELSFDWHADVVSRIFNHRLLIKVFRSMKLPFHLEERLRKGART
ncbi:MAG TPA: NAD(P)/FAD-dependent oxidoreductase [Dehalococcoidales bacterium]